jgi:hypothetical protein
VYLIQSEYVEQPRDIPDVDLAHPFMEGVVFVGCWVDGFYVDLLTGQVATRVGMAPATFPPHANAYGAGEVTGGVAAADADSFVFGAKTGLDNLTTVGSMFALAYHTGNTAVQHAVLQTEEDVVQYSGATLFIDDNAFSANGAVGIEVCDSAATENASGAVLGTSSENLVHVIGGAWNGTNGYFYHSGTTRGSAANAHTATGHASRRTRVNMRHGTSTNMRCGNVLAVGKSYVPSVDEYAHWARRPWAILKPRAPLFFFGPQSTGYLLSAAAGSFALTGNATGLVRGNTLSAAAGSYALTGRAAGLYYGHRLNASAGSYSLTGADALADYSITLSAGAYALTGNAAGLYRGLRLTAAPGSYALTGVAAALKLGRVTAAATGTYALTGSDVTLTKSGARTLAASAGSFSLTGQTVSLLHSARMAAAQGTFTLTGVDIALTRGRVMAAASGSYALAGQAVAFRRTYQLAAAQGSYALSGQSANLIASSAALLAAEAGAFALTGRAVTLRRAALLRASTGYYVLTGFAIDTPAPRVLPRAPTGRQVQSGRRPANVNTGTR